MAIGWKDYVGLRGIDQKKYFSLHNIRNYSEFIALINTGDVVPPLEPEVAHLFVKENLPQVKKSPSVTETVTEKPLPKKKVTAKSSRKTDISKRSSKPRARKSSSRKKSAEKS